MAERISVADAAREVGMNPASLRQAARTGRMFAMFEGEGNRGTYYTTMQDVQEYLDSRPEWIKRREAKRS